MSQIPECATNGLPSITSGTRKLARRGRLFFRVGVDHQWLGV